MEEKRDLEFFMSNPDQVPGNLAELEAALTGGEQSAEAAGNEVLPKTGEQGAASGAEGGEKSAKTGAQGSEPTKGDAAGDGDSGEQQPAQVIKSKNGKHNIPYSVLESERAQRLAAEQAVQQLTQQVEQLAAQVQGKGKGGDETPNDAGAEDLSQERIDEIAADFPQHGAVLNALLRRVGALSQKLDGVSQSDDARRNREAATASTTVQEAIDGNATLSYWQAKEPETFALAVGFDNQIKADPRNKGLSLDERFAKVVDAMQAVYGAAELPEEFRRTATAPRLPSAAAPKPAAKANPETDVVARARQIVASAEAAQRVNSLSDIPGGVPPESDEVTQLGLLSAHDLGNKFMQMTQAQISSVLARAA